MWFRASSIGAFQMIVGLAAFPSSIVAGVLWEKVGMAAPFVFSTALSVVAVVMLLFVKEECNG